MSVTTTAATAPRRGLLAELREDAANCRSRASPLLQANEETPMDLLDFAGQDLYFDEPLPAQVAAQLDEAAERYAEGGAEAPLLRAYFMAPEQLGVLVALYRFYFYQHRLDDALTVAGRVLAAVGPRLGFQAGWRELGNAHLGIGVLRSLGLVRFYLLALKGAGYLSLRLGRLAEGRAMLEKVAELDPSDRMGAAALLAALAPEIDARLHASA